MKSLFTSVCNIYKYNLVNYLETDLDPELLELLPPRFTNDLSFLFEDRPVHL